VAKDRRAFGQEHWGRTADDRRQFRFSFGTTSSLAFKHSLDCIDLRVRISLFILLGRPWFGASIASTKLGQQRFDLNVVGIAGKNSADGRCARGHI
jgi:hypothetical protein